MLFQGGVNEVSNFDSKVFQGSFKGVPRKILGCFKEVSRVFQESFKGVSSEFQGSFKDFLRKCQGYLKRVVSVFQENFNKNVKSVTRMFQ